MPGFNFPYFLGVFCTAILWHIFRHFNPWYFVIFLLLWPLFLYSIRPIIVYIELLLALRKLGAKGNLTQREE